MPALLELGIPGGRGIALGHDRGQVRLRKIVPLLVFDVNEAGVLHCFLRITWNESLASS